MSFCNPVQTCRVGISLSRARSLFHSQTKIFILCFVLIAGALFLFTSTAVATDKQNIAFLPLKINAADESEITDLLDKSLQEVVDVSSLRSEVFLLIPREEAQKKVDYKGGWPPSYESLQSIAARAGLKYVAAGSITLLGKQLSADVILYDVIDPSHPTYYFQEGKSLDDLDEILEKIVADILAYSSRELVILSITPEGNERIDSGAILRQVKVQVGDIYEPDKVRADLKNIYKMGYFDDVQVKLEETDQGKKVAFVVKEKPVIGQVLIDGAKELKEETVREAVTIVPNTIVNPRKVKEAISSIKLLYKEKGFYNTNVTAKLSYPKPDRVDIRFVVEEGAKVFIKELKIVGNDSFSDRKLKKVIETSKKGIFSWLTDSGVLKKEVLEQDAARIGAFYSHHGYIDVKIGKPEVRQDGKWLYITINISEGDRFRVGDINIHGDLIDNKDNLISLLKINQEEFLSRKILREDILRLVDYYSEHGFAFAEANPKIRKSAEDKKVDIDINVQKGALVHINRILIKGNNRTRDKVIRREMKIKEKGIFDSKALRQSHQSLQRLDFFEEINITPEPVAQENQMDIIIDVTEKPTGAFSIGAGYSSVDNLMVMGEISQNNLFGKGQRLAFRANISSSTNRFNIGFTEPHYKDSKLLVGFDLYNWEREYDDYTKDSKGGAIRFGYPIWGKWNIGFSYGFDDTELTDVAETASLVIKDSLDIRITSFVTLGLSRDTRNHPFDPSKGSENSISVKYAGGPLGGDSAFTKVQGTTSWFFPGIKDTTYHFKAVAGHAFENSGGKLPVYEKFYLGGISSIRGYDPGKISPQDPVTNERIGGEAMWYTNVEWIFPLAKSAGLKGVVFFDAGNVYEDSWDFDEVKTSVGGGFRWLSPMGPLRLEWGYVLDPKEDEEQSNWDFSIGGSF